ncbi:class I SAM-dependent methyltransferase [Flavobacteriaceae bacterium]|mgnify:FL=1|nr:class I SAM-dependent methyltransferase [Flavobacteriales bacterium]MBL6877948.1 class I SAM-dependent methyltransferase [Flavobacteriaceae bacterium]MDA9551176.1 class I SAM-dependent methyltransferase [Flavobacteriaceae bacterium]MDA9849894.1 class I SAM-dependent methyltransferase [Flavobacteriaceae bacterium]
MIKLILKIFPRTFLIKFSFIFQPLLGILLSGDKFTDPIDGKSFRKFLSYGYTKLRKNALSPSTLSLERHRLLWLYLKNETVLFEKKIKLLHFAPEQAFYKRFKKLSNIQYDTIDINSPLAKIKADICDLPIKENTYDFILCNHVLEHVLDDNKAMSELYRVLKKGGIGIFQVPIDMKREKTFQDDSITDKLERNKIFGQYDHVRIYGKDYFNKLEDTGFKVQQVDYSKKFSDKEILKFSIIKGEIIPVCTK